MMIELLLAVALLSIVFTSMTRMQISSTRSFDTGSVRANLRARNWRALRRIATELRASSAGGLNGFPETPLWGEAITYDVIDSASDADGSLVWASMRIVLEYDLGEIDDGVDNDGDGLVDEGQVVLIRDWGGAGQRRVVLCHGVREYGEGETFDGNDENGNGLIDERGLSFELDGDTLTIRLTMEAMDREGMVATSTIETAVHFRN